MDRKINDSIVAEGLKKDLTNISLLSANHGETIMGRRQSSMAFFTLEFVGKGTRVAENVDCLFSVNLDCSSLDSWLSVVRRPCALKNTDCF